MTKAMGSGATQLYWDNFSSPGALAWSVLEFLLRKKAPARLVEPKPGSLQRRSSQC